MLTNNDLLILAAVAFVFWLFGKEISSLLSWVFIASVITVLVLYFIDPVDTTFKIQYFTNHIFHRSMGDEIAFQTHETIKNVKHVLFY